MIDGILDLLTGVLVLGIVVLIAFTFILPVGDANVMKYDQTQEDKAFTGTLSYDEDSGLVPRNTYTFSELLLLIAVQDSQMPQPRAISYRNVVSDTDYAYDLMWDTEWDLNTSGTSDSASRALRYFADNCLDDVYDDKTTEWNNWAVSSVNDDYGIFVDDFLNKFADTTDGNNYASPNEGNEDKEFYIYYHMPILDLDGEDFDKYNEYIEDKDELIDNYSDGMYFIEVIDNVAGIDTINDYYEYLEDMRGLY